MYVILVYTNKLDLRRIQKQKRQEALVLLEELSEKYSQ